MISKTIGFRGTQHFQTHPADSFDCLPRCSRIADGSREVGRCCEMRCLWSASCVVEPGCSLWPTSASGCHWLESADSGTHRWEMVGCRGTWRQSLATKLWPCQVDLVLRGLCRLDTRMWGLPMQMRYTTVVPQNGHFALEHHFFNRPIYFPLNFQTNPWVNEISSW